MWQCERCVFNFTFHFVQQKGLENLFRTATDDPEVNTEGLELPADLKELPFQMNWSAELPSEFSVPTANLHSLTLDFSAVSFLDISAMKGLKMVKQQIRPQSHKSTRAFNHRMILGDCDSYFSSILWINTK